MPLAPENRLREAEDLILSGDCKLVIPKHIILTLQLRQFIFMLVVDSLRYLTSNLWLLWLLGSTAIVFWERNLGFSLNHVIFLVKYFVSFLLHV